MKMQDDGREPERGMSRSRLTWECCSWRGLRLRHAPILRPRVCPLAVPGLPAAQEQQYHELGYTVLRGVIEESELRC